MKATVVIDIAIPNDSNIGKKEHDKYQRLREKLKKICRVKATVVPVVI